MEAPASLSESPVLSDGGLGPGWVLHSLFWTPDPNINEHVTSAAFVDWLGGSGPTVHTEPWSWPLGLQQPSQLSLIVSPLP